MMRPIDLRSDTITHPTAAMREAMANAEVGDDVLGDDPTVKALEALAAEKLAKPAALFVTSGTMGNLVCQMVHCQRGDEMILGNESHIYYYEQGGTAAIGNIQSRAVANQPDGTMSPEDIQAAIRPDDIHYPVSRLIAIENTHNRCWGSPIDLAYMNVIRDIADTHGLKVHVDGARIFNAAQALGCTAAQLAAHADSITFCLSKGLGAPAGSLICGEPDFIKKAKRLRKVLGGGMRQVGVLAAAGIVALNEMVERLAQDHANAKRLAQGLNRISGLSVDPDRVKTNFVYFNIRRPDVTEDAFADHLNAGGVCVLPSGPQQLRAVTQYHVSAEDVDIALKRISHTIESDCVGGK